MTLLLVAFLAFVMLIAGVIWIGSKVPRPARPQSSGVVQPAPARPAMLVGEEVVLELPGGSGVWLATSDEGWDQMLDAENRQDMEEMRVLMARGKVVYERNGTRAKVIKTTITSRKVRVRDGANPGVEAWVQAEFVRPVK